MPSCLVSARLGERQYSSRHDNGRSRVPVDALHIGRWAMRRGPDVCHPWVSALVLLASGLPRHAQLRSDLRPADALADGSLDEDRQFFLGFVSLDPRLPDSLKQLGLGQLADSPRMI